MDKNKLSAADRIIEDISENIRNGILPPDSKIAPENKLTVKYNANLYTVRKALNILKDKGILYSVPKFGVFVAQNAEQTLAVQSQNMPMRNILPDITLASRSQLAGQRAIWAEIAEKYAALPLGGRLKLHYVHGYEDVFPKADIYEYGSLSQSFLHNTNLLEVSKYFPYIIENKSAVITPCGIPFYYVTPMLIFNKNILKKLKIAPPQYSNYKEQKEYIEKVNQAAYGKFKLSGTTQELTLHLGNKFIDDFFSFLQQKNCNEADFCKKFAARFSEVTDFWSKNAVSYPKNKTGAYADFALGNTPFLFGMSSDLIRLEENNTTFEYGSAMMYTFDDTFARIQLFLSIDRDVKNPIECMRLLRLFQGADIQRHIAANGSVPLNGRDYEALPFDLIINEKNAAQPLFFRNYDEYYIIMQIICRELWEVIICGKTLNNAMHDIFNFTQSYIHMKNKFN